jgi:L-lactate dehydrogenase complex protein LldG
VANKVRTTREVMLERIRLANGDGPVSTFADGPLLEWKNLPRAYQRVGTLEKAARTELFAERMTDYNAGVYYSEEVGLRDVIAQVLHERGKQAILMPNGFPREWIPEEVRVMKEADFANASFDSAEAEVIENVITGCTVAIAATGTVVLQHGAGEGVRMLSLLPDYHLCVVGEDQIVETVPEGLAKLDPVRPTTTISGPSATADIEMTRIKGVHGPRFLDVVIVR